MLREIPLKQQIDESSLVIEGKVISKQSFWDTDYKNIYTVNTIEVYKVFKGEAVTIIEVITPGGAVGDRIQKVIPSLKLRKGDLGAFTLHESHINISESNKSGNKQFKVYSSLQGFYKYHLNDNVATNPFSSKNGITKELYNQIESITKAKYVDVSFFDVSKAHSKLVENKSVLQPPSSITFNPTTSTAGTKSVLTISGSGFGGTKGKVGFANADEGGVDNGNTIFFDALDTQVLTWSDTQITVEIPSEAGTGKIRVTDASLSSSESAADLNITYAEVNSVSDFLANGVEYAYQTRHIDADGSGGYTWEMHTEFNANTNAKSAFLRALETWSCETGINFSVASSATTVDEVKDDDTFVVRFDNGSELPAGNLGVCTYFIGLCGSSAVGQTSVEAYVDELDIVFDDGTDWNFGPGLSTVIGQFDFESVALHELGHGHQLGHVIDTNAIMHFSLSPNEEQRVLDANDIIAANNIQNRSTGSTVCGESAMTNYSGDCGLSIDEEELNSSISLYPNPAKSVFYINNESFMNLEKVIIYDISGRQISEYDISNTSQIKTINLVGISKGIYFVNIHSNSAMITKKIAVE
ncbi:hypothetical protein GCM10022397_18640 [Flavivirga jejuensis]